MIFRSAFLFLAILTLLGGCASTPRPPESHAPESRVAPPAAPEQPVTTAHKKPKSPAAESGETDPHLVAGEYMMLVESVPWGATVVVNGKPWGKTPCRVKVRTNSRGFVREQVSIKVRFVAANEAQSSQTVEDVLTTFDKVPAEMHFTIAGVRRVVR